MKNDQLTAAGRNSIRTVFIGRVISASWRLLNKHCKARAAAIRARKGEGWDMVDLMEEVQYQSILEDQGVPSHEAPRLECSSRKRTSRVSERYTNWKKWV